jgi:hypothetical protein
LIDRVQSSKDESEAEAIQVKPQLSPNLGIEREPLIKEPAKNDMNDEQRERLRMAF